MTEQVPPFCACRLLELFDMRKAWVHVQRRVAEDVNLIFRGSSESLKYHVHVVGHVMVNSCEASESMLGTVTTFDACVG